MKQKFQVLTLFCAVLLGFSACGDTETTPSGVPVETESAVSTEAAETEEAPLFTALPEKDYGGYTFTILTRDGDDHRMEAFAEAENGEPINDAVYLRNSLVGERYNVKFDFVYADEGNEYTLTDLVRESVMAGSEDYDLAIPQTTYGGFAAPDGFYYNWLEMPYVDFNKPWWNADSAKRLTINNKLHIAIGDYLMTQIDYTWCMIFNKAMVADYDLENPYQLVKDGKWTIDVFADYIKNISADINGDGKMTIDDRFGFATQNDSAFGTWSYSTDLSVAEYDKDGRPIITIDNEKTYEVVEKLYSIMYEGDNTFIIGGWQDEEALVPRYESGGILMLATKFNAISPLRSMKTDFGVLPYPKYDEAQERYFTQVDLHAGVLMIPVTLSDPERSGMIIEALNEASNRYVIPAYYDITLKTKGARDDESAEMLDLILDGRYITFVSAYEGWEGVQWFMINVLKNKKTDFASHYEKNIKKSLTRYDKIFEAYSNMD